MKKLFTLMALAFVCTAATAQNDTTTVSISVKTDTIPEKKSDTIRVGNIVIVTSGKHNWDYGTNITVEKDHHRHQSNVSTNWLVFDLGFENYSDQTNYPAATAGQFLVNQPGTTYPLGPGDFKLKANKSVDVNIWLFMQRLNLYQHRLNLIYGLGIELNNYRFNSNISFKDAGYAPYPSITNAIPHGYVIRDSISFSKNKLAADYVTVPVMLNFAGNPENHNRGISFSAGISIGYLYNSRNKQISAERGTFKNFGPFGVEQFKFSYVAELGLGPVRLYGSYSPQSIFEEGLDLRSYAIGIRLGYW